MNRINSLFEASIKEPTAVALGFFDGVHLGHRAVISAAADFFSEGLIPVAFTFKNEGRYSGIKSGGRIYSSDTRAKLLLSAGAVSVIDPDFSEIESLSGGEFLELLYNNLNARALICGEDYRFGHNAKEDVGSLRTLCGRFNIKLSVVKKVKLRGERVSSTGIKELLRLGKMEEAGRLLGEPYRLQGIVEHGRQLGGKLNFPTVNQPFHENPALPRLGVYISRAYVGDRCYAAVTNVGVSPTVGEASRPKAETHILDFSGDLYGKMLLVELTSFLRPERQFNSLLELKAAIQSDCDSARLQQSRLKQP